MRQHLLRHLQVLIASLGRMAQRPMSTAMTLTGIGMALAVPLVLYGLVVNLSAVFGTIGDSPRMTAYLEVGVDRSYAEALTSQLSEDPWVAAVNLIDRDEGLAELTGEGDLAGIAEQLGGNPLPHVIEVRPSPGIDQSVYRELGERIGALEGVADVQLDLEWVERLRAITALAMGVVRAFWVLLFVGVAMVIANTVRLGLVTARDEIEVISLVGGSESFIRRPYLYLGLLQGVLGAVLAIVIAYAVHLLLSSPLERVIETWLGAKEVRFAPGSVLLRMVLGAGLVGWFAALLSTRRYLRDALPK